MKVKTTSWKQPQDEKAMNEETLNKTAIRLGFAALIFVVGFYSGSLFLLMRVLKWQGVTSIDLEWSACLALSAIYVLIRWIDRSFFRNET